MFHKIKTAAAIDDHRLYVIYQNGEIREFDINPLIKKYPIFKKLKDNPTLFESVKVDVGGYGLIWDEELDLDAEGIYEQSKIVTGGPSYQETVGILINYLASYRKKQNISQQDLAKLSNVAQPCIARIEKKKTDPQLSTFVKLLSSLGLKLQIVKDN